MSRQCPRPLAPTALFIPLTPKHQQDAHSHLRPLSLRRLHLRSLFVGLFHVIHRLARCERALRRVLRAQRYLIPRVEKALQGFAERFPEANLATAFESARRGLAVVPVGDGGDYVQDLVQRRGHLAICARIPHRRLPELAVLARVDPAAAVSMEGAKQHTPIVQYSGASAAPREIRVLQHGLNQLLVRVIQDAVTLCLPSVDGP